MSIEFRCHRCQRLLRTADDTGGRQTKCPECGTILDIPAPTAEPPLHRPPEVAASAAAGPFAVQSAPGAVLDIGELLSTTWDIYSKNLAPLLLGTLILIGVCLAMLIPFLLVLGIAVAISAALADGGNEELGAVIIIASMSLFVVLLLIASLWLYGGYMKWMLKIARGQPNNLGDIFTGGRYFPSLAGAGLLFMLAIVIGYLLCIVPGIVLSLMLSQFAWLIVDRDTGMIDSFSRSMQITAGNRLQLFLLMLLAIVINGAANLIPFAFVFTAPFMWLLMATTYLRLSSELPMRPAQPVVP
jgi:phage FluMu protein Com